MLWWRVGAVLAGLGLLGCQEAIRPAPVGDPTPVAVEPGSLVDPVPTPMPNTNSPCGAATVALDFVRPNLYFAIDASGSMTDAIPRGEAGYAVGSVPVNRYAALSRALQSLLLRVGHRVNYGATLFPSGDVTCDAGKEVHALGPGDDVSFAVSGEPGPVLRSFMFNVTRRTPRGGTPVALALSALAQGLSGAGPDTYLFLLTDGGPNCNPRALCGADTCIPNIERVQVSDGLVCSDDVNCCDDGLFGSDNCLDTDGSLVAVQTLAAAGVRTFVIGMPGSEAYSSLLDQLALAGGVAQPSSPHYYRVADAEALSATVGALGVTLALDCNIELTRPPADPSLVNLFFDGQVVPSEPVNGWTLSNGTTVQVQGASCDLLQTGQVLQADVVAGCPIVLH